MKNQDLKPTEQIKSMDDVLKLVVPTKLQAKWLAYKSNHKKYRMRRDSAKLQLISKALLKQNPIDFSKPISWATI